MYTELYLDVHLITRDIYMAPSSLNCILESSVWRRLHFLPGSKPLPSFIIITWAGPLAVFVKPSSGTDSTLHDIWLSKAC